VLQKGALGRQPCVKKGTIILSVCVQTYNTTWINGVGTEFTLTLKTKASSSRRISVFLTLVEG
jgi:hypothetical protein